MSMHGYGPAPKPEKRVKVPKRRATGNQYKDTAINEEDTLAAKLTRDTGLRHYRRSGSGANKLKPGDIYSDPRTRVPSHKWLYEDKVSTVRTSRGETVYTVKLEDLDQIIAEASQENSLPALLYRHADSLQVYVTLTYETFVRLLSEHVELFAENARLEDALLRAVEESEQ
jgi:hypothetical protein